MGAIKDTTVPLKWRHSYPPHHIQKLQIGNCWGGFASVLITGASLVASTPVKLEVGVLFGPYAFCSAKRSTLLF
jgi:hypothetical protein